MSCRYAFSTIARISAVYATGSLTDRSVTLILGRRATGNSQPLLNNRHVRIHLLKAPDKIDFQLE